MKFKFNIFAIAFVFGYIFELAMTNFWGYDMIPRTFGVPIPIVLVWAAGLTSLYYVMKEIKSSVPDYLAILFIYVPSIILIEYIGNQILNITINESFTCIMGSFMCAPYLYYLVAYLVGLFFWNVVKDK